MVLRKDQLEASLHEEQQLIQTGRLKEESPLDRSQTFADLCSACRQGSLRKCHEAILAGANINAHDEFDYTPLILASLCGHYELVKLLLESGALCERDTFQGERCLYNALTERIRNLLLSYDYSKAVDQLQPYTAHVTSLLARESPKTSDIVVTSADRSFNLHKFILAARSPYFRKKLQNAPETVAWKLPATVPPQSFEVAIRYLYLGELPTDVGSGPGTGFTEEQVLAGIDRVSTHLEIRSLWDGILEVGNRRLARQRQADESERGRSQLEAWFRENVLRHKLVVETAKADDIKWDRSNGIYADVLLCADEDEEDEDADEDADLSNGTQTLQSSGGVTLDLAPKLQMVDGSGLTRIPVGPLGLAASTADEPASTPVPRPRTSTVFPAHKAMLLRSDYFAAMFSSAFMEAEESPHLKIIPVDCSPAVLEQVLNFLYTDKAELPLPLAPSVLFAADMLLIDRLKNKAALIISTLGDDSASKSKNAGSGKVGKSNKTMTAPGVAEDESIDPIAVLHAAWLTRVPRLETFAARYFAYRLEDYIDQPEFHELVAESAARIRNRQKTDSIELVDDIRYYLSERFRLRFEGEGIEEILTERVEEIEGLMGVPPGPPETSGEPTAWDGNGRRYVTETTFHEVVSEEHGRPIRTLDGELAGDEFASDAINYRVLLVKIDTLLEKLDLDG